ncbi:MAG: LUD domain-containing protein, partial [Rhizomicrobium sp.]
MTADPRNFPEASRAALRDPGLRIALGRLRTHFALGRAQAVERYPDWEGLRESGRAIRDYTLAHLDTLLLRFEQNVQASGGHVHWARDAREAREMVLAILRGADARTVIKGKSMVSEEVGLNRFLAANGIETVETDLGEYIVQLRREPPSHIIAPAFHLNKEDVVRTFRDAHD